MSMYQYEVMKQREQYPNLWRTDLFKAPVADCPFCMFSCFCGPCASFLLRSRALYGDLSRYQCCGGFMPCSGSCGERSCPAFCLVCEVFWCFPASVAATRFLIQDQMNIMTSKCDNCIIGFMIVLQQLACIVSCIACIIGSDELNAAANALNCLADIVYCSVCACMQTQHKVELDKRDGKFGDAPMQPPPQQQMS